MYCNRSEKQHNSQSMLISSNLEVLRLTESKEVVPKNCWVCRNRMYCGGVSIRMQTVGRAAVGAETSLDMAC